MRYRPVAPVIPLALALLCSAVAAQEAATITVHADQKLFRLSDMMIGANMEDLHYQMVGGFDSQLIHGESFFEPSPTQLAPVSAVVDGFANCGGNVAVDNGELVAEKGTRLTAQGQAIEASIDVKAAGGAGLAICVSADNADNKWEWYSGYTAELLPDHVVLTRAARANKHIEVARAPITAAGWVRLGLRTDGPAVIVRVNGKDVIRYQDDQPLPPGCWAIIAQGEGRFRSAQPFKMNPLLTTPGDAISLRWQKVCTGTAMGTFAIETAGTWLANCPSQTIAMTGGDGEWGIDNAGLKRWGINLVADRLYEGYLRVKATKGTEIVVSLRSADGAVLADAPLHTSGTGEYEKVAFTMTPKSSDAKGRFAVTLRKPGSITLGYVFLQPGEWGRYKELCVRKDLAEALLAQGIRVLRFNGGMIERPDYRWKNMRGPRDPRPPYDGFYDRYCSSGFGPYEAVLFGEAAGLIVVPGLNIDESPEDVADFVSACLPHGLQYFQFANESAFDRTYVEKFKPVAEAVWKVAPDITLVTTVLRGRSPLAIELATFAHQHGKKLLFDMHDFGGAKNVPGIADTARWLQQSVPSSADVSVGILEFNAGAFDFQRGLSHAMETNAAFRAGDVIRAVGMPNVSQPWGVYQTDWKAVLWTQGNIYYTPNRVWFQPAYYVDQMTARNWAPNIVASETSGLDVIAGVSDDGKLVLRVVNSSPSPVRTTLTVGGIQPTRPEASVEELTGEPSAFNTMEEPERIKPIQRTWRHETEAGRTTYTFPANSFTILSLQ